MDSCSVKLLQATPLCVAVHAIRTCYQSYGKSDDCGPKDIKMIKGIIKMGHTSTLEHLNYTFFVEDISRICSHQLVRHRIASYSQQSHRYTKVTSFIIPDELESEKTEVAEFLYKSQQLYNRLLQKNISKESARYIIPQAATTKITITINARSLRNFFLLRTNPSTQSETRDLAYKMYEKLPKDHKFIFEDVIYNRKEDNGNENK